MAEYTFYTNPMSRGQIARWALHEAGAGYDQVLVNWADKPAAFLAANPMGKVPTLVHHAPGGDRVVTGAAAICGYLAEEMVTGILGEILLGLRRDPVYGVTLTLGMGGVTAEVLADTVTVVLPATEAVVMAALRRLRLWPLLDGYRGRPRADMAAVAALAVQLAGQMLADDSLEEIEINPVLVREQGAVAVDALIRRI